MIRFSLFSALIVAGCATPVDDARVPTWSDLGVSVAESNQIEQASRISHDEASALVAKRLRTLNFELTFDRRTEHDASAYVRLREPIDARTDGFATFRRTMSGWELEPLALRIDGVSIESKIDGAIAQRLIAWRSTYPGLPKAKLQTIARDEADRFVLGFVVEDDGGECVCTMGARVVARINAASEVEEVSREDPDPENMLCGFNGDANR
jgi:hypothetical protein